MEALRFHWVAEATPEDVVGWMFDALDKAGDDTVPRTNGARAEAIAMTGMVFADLAEDLDYGAVVSNALRAAQGTEEDDDDE